MLFIDSADIAAITALQRSGIFRGVTTNPTIFARAGRNLREIPDLYAALNELHIEIIMFQAVGSSALEMSQHARNIAQLGSNVIVKIPAAPIGYETIAALTAEEFPAPILLTAVYHPAQAVIACELGCWGIAPYAGRLSDMGRDPVVTIGKMADILSGSSTRVLAASLRNADIVGDLAARGVRDFTVSPETAHELIHNPDSLAALAGFDRDVRW
ncbi:transaldolase family protein [Trueperella sp. LYQ143]|uniref:transaldolase family protein n=1 Tax=unclassified Trueperella TaxID=2630174 RepID=UPI0039830171